ncbi:hypothetical protein GCM10007094_34130 [Pseudovibrio japonicus]|uniref:Alpha/beta hydrolase n=2 Tax=Pseudovibrio japonicus TaxID=366534 RepID=A0ABQ3EMW1_9HYPH|nr:hypothetical protein GCM10007094_34130 [Pseudovibrio japonicus]
MQVLFEDENLIITERGETDAKSNTVLISFTGVGHKLGGIDVQKPEFFGAGKNFDNFIFVTDRRRSWGNNINFDLLKKIILRVSKDKKLFCLGNSMGGFLSIVATKFLTIEVSVSFVPQYSVKPEIVPFETRWVNYTQDIEHYKIHSLDEYFNNSTKYYIFTSRDRLDYMQAKLFPKRNNIYHFNYRKIKHDLARQLKMNQELTPLLLHCFSGQDIKSLRGAVKLSPRQIAPWKTIFDALRLRHPGIFPPIF